MDSTNKTFKNSDFKKTGAISCKANSTKKPKYYKAKTRKYHQTFYLASKTFLNFWQFFYQGG